MNRKDKVFEKKLSKEFLESHNIEKTKIKLLCKLFGHKWKCYMAVTSCCSRCGMMFGDHLSPEKRQELIDKQKQEEER